jgi:putative molybdopterin biosynthesis protein
MQSIEQLRSFDQIKILSDPRRLVILRRLMAGPATLTQLGQMMGEHPAWIRHHLKQLEQAGLIELVSTQVGAGFVEKYYQARARAFILQQTILPDLPQQHTLILLGSHDIALGLLAQSLASRADLELLVLPVGSLDGLIALRQGLAHLTGCHLLDIDSGEYNLPYVRHLFPERPMKLVTLAHREQGLLIAPGNPHQIRGLADLARGDVTFINRNAGSGTRLWLDKQLGRLGISGGQIRGYNREARTHTVVAQAVAQGQADAGLGLAAAARQYSLDFIPMFQERFDLVIPAESLEEASLRRLLEALHGREFRHMAEALGGYSTVHTGEEMTT